MYRHKKSLYGWQRQRPLKNHHSPPTAQGIKYFYQAIGPIY